MYCDCGSFTIFDPGPSPTSSRTKTSRHDIVKCGWICTACKRSDRHRFKLEEVPCSVLPAGHAFLEKALMCQKCDCLADDFKAFKEEECSEATVRKLEYATPKALARTESVDSLTLSTPTPAGPKGGDVSGRDEKARILLKLQVEEATMRRLKLLRELEIERQRFSELLLSKHGSSHFA